MDERISAERLRELYRAFNARDIDHVSGAWTWRSRPTEA
jgi:hypothetical protein